MNDFGLNVNDYWTLRSGTIAEAIPNGEAKREAFEQMRARQAAQVAEARRVRARGRLQRLRRLAPLLGRWSLYMQQLHAEVSFRPGGQGAKRCRDEFEALAAGGALDVVPGPNRLCAPTSLRF